MTPQDIDRMYRSAHILKNDENDMPCFVFSRYEFAKQIAAAEREACAKLCENSDRYRGDYFSAIIRARKGGATC